MRVKLSKKGDLCVSWLIIHMSQRLWGCGTTDGLCAAKTPRHKNLPSYEHRVRNSGDGSVHRCFLRNCISKIIALISIPTNKLTSVKIPI